LNFVPACPRWLLCLVLLIPALFPACSMDEGFDGNLPPVNVFLDVWGCAAADSQVFSAFVPFDVTSLDVTLEVAQGEADLLLGRDGFPLIYASPGQGPGSQALRVGTMSYQPIQGGTWSVTVASPGTVATECDPANPTDWHMVMQRTGTPGGFVLLEEACRSAECAVPACAQAVCPVREFRVDLPLDAASLQVDLDSLQGDADLILLSAPAELAQPAVLGSSLNPGPGYDLVRLGPDVIVPLQGQAVTVRLESWAQSTDAYNLRVAYGP